MGISAVLRTLNPFKKTAAGHSAGRDVDAFTSARKPDLGPAELDRLTDAALSDVDRGQVLADLNAHLEQRIERARSST